MTQRAVLAMAAALAAVSVAVAFPAVADNGELEDASDGGAHEFRADVHRLLVEKDFAALDGLAEKLRSQQRHFKGGAWQLHVFYGELSSPGSETATDAKWVALIAQLENWAGRVPRSPTAPVALGQAYLRFAWKARGHGYSDTVTPDGADLFAQRVQAARRSLERAADLTPQCPEWFLEMQKVALAQGWNRSGMDALTDRGLAAAPGYYYIAVLEANYLLPKWHGSPGETERFALDVADRLGADDGATAYFRIAAELNCCRKSQAPGLAWARVQQGFASMERRFGATNYELNLMAYLALRAGDRQSADRLFDRIRNDWNKGVWKTKALFDASRTGHAIADTAPLDADTDG